MVGEQGIIAFLHLKRGGYFIFQTLSHFLVFSLNFGGIHPLSIFAQ
jgi:hypothetical protein